MLCASKILSTRGKTADYFKQSNEAGLMIKKLERDGNELRGKPSGSRREEISEQHRLRTALGA